jgi:thiamine kinase-like enzyme
MFNVIKFLFIKKANYAHINSILIKEGFMYTSQDIENLLKGNQKGTRYGNIVLERNEDSHRIKRFLKIVINGKFETYKLFIRQVKITEALHKNIKITSPTTALIKSCLTFPVPYAIFETREDGEDFGFMHDKPSFYEKFNEKEMYDLVNTIYSFHNTGTSINPNIWKYTRKMTSNINHYKKESQKWLKTKIIHKSVDGKIVEKKVEELLTLITGIQNIKEIIMGIFDKNWQCVINSKVNNKYYLVHADMQIDNLYKHQNGTIELLDFEWVGKSDNPVIAIMYDYGNLRARAWSSKQFQEMLEVTMLEVGKEYYNIEIIKAGLDLGILRSSIMMCRYHLDFKNTTRNDKRTEEDYQNMYPKTIASLVNILKKYS